MSSVANPFHTVADGSDLHWPLANKPERDDLGNSASCVLPATRRPSRHAPFLRSHRPGLPLARVPRSSASADDVGKDDATRREIARGFAAIDSRSARGSRSSFAAAEPLVKDPIAFEWGADGEALESSWRWAIIRSASTAKASRAGVVRYLEDLDGDGRYDRSTVFLDGLRVPDRGLIPWREGVIVASCPDIFFAEDRDQRRPRPIIAFCFFTGFREGEPEQQHRLNGFELGLDGWIYGANGDSGDHDQIDQDRASW